MRFVLNVPELSITFLCTYVSMFDGCAWSVGSRCDM